MKKEDFMILVLNHDNCGIGAIVNIKGNKTHDTVSGA